MSTLRPILEVLKWLPAESILLHTSLVSARWCQASNSDELWISLSESYDLVPTRPPYQRFKDGFHQLFPSFSLYLFLYDSVHKYDCRSDEFSLEVTFESKLENDYAVGVAVLRGLCVVLCGGNSSSAFSFDWTGKKTTLADMNCARSFHSIVHSNGVLYVFGGDVDGTAEKLQLSPLAQASEQQWVVLPKPTVRHSACCPCLHSNVIYLCGGNTTTSESFHIPTEVYTVLPFLLPEAAYGCATFMKKGELVMVTQGFVSRWADGELRVTAKAESYSGMWSNTPQCVMGEYVYSSTHSTVQRFSLLTGVREDYRQLSR